MNATIPLLPLPLDLETKPVLKALTRAHRALAELKGTAGIVPNETILISTLSLQEAKDSSAIENIVTTQDDLYRSDAASSQFTTLAAKEVHAYAQALREGFERVRKTGLITCNDILQIQATLEDNRAGFRKLPGTALKNDRTGETVYMPPQSHAEIVALMDNLERFINDDDLSDLDPLVKMAVIHHRFETVHPFYDGNGRTGRILNILYLVKEGLLGTPILYLSRYINQNKPEYYRLLQAVRDGEAWEEWVLFLLAGVEQTSRRATALVFGIRDLMQSHKNRMRGELPAIYSQDLLYNLFRHPYTKIDYVVSDLGVTRKTATKYLEEIVRAGLLSKHKHGRENYYINDDLCKLFLSVGAKTDAGK